MRSICAFLILTVAVALPAFGAKERAFEATSFEYNVNSNPQVSSRKWKSKISIFHKESIHIVEIKNFVNKKSKFDRLIKIIQSADNVGSLIYNNKMLVVADFPKGKIEGENIYSFNVEGEKTDSKAMWYIHTDEIMSDFMLWDKTGILLYKETVIYRAKHPGR